jgi:PadR family transcriptional regulator, regulatory protein AphA
MMPGTARTRDAPSAPDLPLSNSAAAVLGMVALGAQSGYQIRRAAELSLRFFWALGPPQIYSELARLEAAGLVTGQDDSRGRRARRTYELTTRGRIALTRWVSSREPAPLELRDLLLLQLFFSDVADPADVTALLHRMRERSVQARASFEDHIIPAATRSEERGFGQPKVVADFGVALHRFIVNWCDERLRDD